MIVSTVTVLHYRDIRTAYSLHINYLQFKLFATNFFLSLLICKLFFWLHIVVIYFYTLLWVRQPLFQPHGWFGVILFPSSLTFCVVSQNMDGMSSLVMIAIFSPTPIFRSTFIIPIHPWLFFNASSGRSQPTEAKSQSSVVLCEAFLSHSESVIFTPAQKHYDYFAPNQYYYDL